MTDLPIPHCASEVYQYVSNLIGNSLQEIEQLILQMGTRQDDTVINVGKKIVKLKESTVTSDGSSSVAKQTSKNFEKFFSSENEPGKLNCLGEYRSRDESEQIKNLLCFPVDNEARSLRYTDRIFESLDKKAVILMREYDSPPIDNLSQKQSFGFNHYYQQLKSSKKQPKIKIITDRKSHHQKQQQPEMESTRSQDKRYRSEDQEKLYISDKVFQEESTPRNEKIDQIQKSRNLCEEERRNLQHAHIYERGGSSQQQKHNKHNKSKHAKKKEKLKRKHEQKVKTQKKQMPAIEDSDSDNSSRSLSKQKRIIKTNAKRSGKKAQKRRTNRHTEPTDMLEHQLTAEQRDKIRQMSATRRKHYSPYGSSNENVEHRIGSTEDLSREFHSAEKTTRKENIRRLWCVQPQHLYHSGYLPKHGISPMIDATGTQKIVMKGWNPSFKVKTIRLQSSPPK
ncbi:unnamed protein product [Thelazia callipaeda]|uniref:Uncharacterized protein n=1 Tax=Thelazia callipaeda TaxID=103827 RepID=A0A0N5CS49_THECL|nr:unnamed protein product [Thelazia callipaeda]